MNLVKIANACAIECERQKVGLRELGYLIDAYLWISDPGANPAARQADELFFEILGSFVEPGINRQGYRKVPVTFANGGSSGPASLIPRMMNGLVKEIAIGDMTHDHYVKEFLWIHPFRDGNGRVAFLLQNFLDGTLDDPQPLRNHFG